MVLACTSQACPAPWLSTSVPSTQMQAPVVTCFSSSSSNCDGSATTCMLLMVEPSLRAIKSTALEERWVRTHPFTQTVFPYSVDWRRSTILILDIYTLFILWVFTHGVQEFLSPGIPALLIRSHAQAIDFFLGEVAPIAPAEIFLGEARK